MQFVSVLFYNDNAITSLVVEKVGNVIDLILAKLKDASTVQVKKNCMIALGNAIAEK